VTLRCEACDGPVILVDDNGAEYPETRVEFYECDQCGHRQRKVLVA
jgi:Zn ribbon nucleic-acid-binding protein